jgi:tRNA (guanine37-N1)-methyltransferase
VVEHRYARRVLGFRRLMIDEAGEALTLQHAAFVAEARIYGTVDIPPLLDTLDDIVREVSSAVMTGAFDGARLVGSVRLTLEGTIGWISRVAVAPDRQGEGIGSALLRQAESTAPISVATFQLTAGAKSGDNLRLYERLGYRLVEYRPDAVGITMALMTKTRVRNDLR